MSLLTTLRAKDFHWDGVAGQGKADWMVYDGTYLYCLCRGDDAKTFTPKMVTIDPATLTTNGAVWTSPATSQECVGLTQDTNYVYAAVVTSSPDLKTRVYQISKATRATVATSDPFNDGYGFYGCLVNDTNYVYLALASDPGKVIKIQKTDMATAATWTGATGETQATGLCLDGADTLYVGLAGATTALVKKVSRATMETVGTSPSQWAGAAGEAVSRCILADATHLFIGMFAGEPVGFKIVKVNKTTLLMDSDKDYYAGITGKQGSVNCIEEGGDYIYCGVDSATAQLMIMEKSRLLPVVIKMVATDVSVSSACFISPYCYVSHESETAKVSVYPGILDPAQQAAQFDLDAAVLETNKAGILKPADSVPAAAIQTEFGVAGQAEQTSGGGSEISPFDILLP